ncbi:MAG: peptidase M14 [Myxococcales bacterium]|nr:peptidase M14 [Myxococcales bacterium]
MPGPSSVRERYLDHAQLTAQLRTWATQHPDFIRLRALTTTEGGRELWLLTIGPRPDEPRPALWVDANMHASELCGSNVALAVAEELIALHLDPDARPLGLPAHVCARLRSIHVHVAPRLSPDGAEVILKGETLVRSIPRDPLGYASTRPRWIPQDLDGDGCVRTIRVLDATGEFCESAALPGLMLPRRLEDEGPFYKLYPEGVIEGYDGRTIPCPAGMGGRGIDLNRNFPARWVPEPEQVGAGPFALSERESRAIAEFAVTHPTIFAWFNLHTFGGVVIRPPGERPDHTLDPHDRHVFDQLARWAKQHARYPTVGGFEQFTYTPQKPLHGDLIDFVYRQRGCLAVAVELWDLFAQAGIRRRDRAGERFVDVYDELTRDELIALARWDREHNAGRCAAAWRPFRHPQLGDVELGGYDPRFGLWNPPAERLAALCREHAALILRTAALAPAIEITAARVIPQGPGRWAIDITVENHGYLGSYGVASARARPWNEPLRAELVTQGALELDEPDDGARELGHLDGWGRGPHGENAAAFFQRSRGSSGRAHARWHVVGHGVARVRVSGARVGTIERVLELPEE